MHPNSPGIRGVVEIISHVYKIILISLIVIGLITAIVAAVGLEEYSDDVPVNFFGYIIELEEETFGNNPVVIFFYVVTVFALIITFLSCIQMVVSTLLNTKANALDTLYKNQKLTELLVLNLCSQQEKSDNSNT